MKFNKETRAGVLDAKVGYFGVKSTKVLREQMGTKNLLLKSVALAPGVLKCGAAPNPPPTGASAKRSSILRGCGATPRAKLLKSAPRADQSC